MGGSTAERDRLSSHWTPDFSTLSARGQAILRSVALPLSLGFSEAEVARALQTSRRSISEMLDELRGELEAGPS